MAMKIDRHFHMAASFRPGQTATLSRYQAQLSQVEFELSVEQLHKDSVGKTAKLYQMKENH
jgi:hypothetical protein